METISRRRGQPTRWVRSTAFAMSMILACSAQILAQTVGPEIVIRGPSISGGVFERAVAFGSGSAFIVWLDTRNDATTDSDIYVQKVGPDGKAAWTSDGLPVCLFAQQQWEATVVADGTGGAVVAWRDQRAVGARYIFAQRVSSVGETLWDTDGLRVGDARSGEQYNPALHLAPDGNFLLTYGETRSGFPSTYWIIAQKIDGAGQRLWGTNGVEALNGVRTVRSLADGKGGIVVLGRRRDDPDGFRFQRVLADQSLAWANPVEVEATLPFTPQFDFATDGAGGVVLAYIEGGTVRAVRVTGDGKMPWSEASTMLAPTNVVTSQPVAVAPDGTGGVLIAWVSNSPRDVHVQHIAADGTHLWPVGGAVVPDLSGSEGEVALVSDGAGGIFVSFETFSSLRAQRLNSSGVGQWKTGTTNGLSLMTGFDPVIGLGASDPIVVYDKGFGLSARTIDVPEPYSFRLTNAVFLPSGDFSFTLTGVVAGVTYDIFRSTSLRGSWSRVGGVQAGATWTDTEPPSPTAFYYAAEKP